MPQRVKWGWWQNKTENSFLDWVKDILVGLHQHHKFPKVQHYQRPKFLWHGHHQLPRTYFLMYKIVQHPEKICRVHCRSWSWILQCHPIPQCMTPLLCLFHRRKAWQDFKLIGSSWESVQKHYSDPTVLPFTIGTISHSHATMTRRIIFDFLPWIVKQPCSYLTIGRCRKHKLQ